MGKVFSDLADLHRTFTQPVTGTNYTTKKKERHAEAVRLKEFLYAGPPRKSRIRLTLFSALVWRCGMRNGQLACSKTRLPVEITEAWDSQDFYRYATPFEQQNSVLCTHANQLSNAAVKSGGRNQSFMPIVLDTGDLDAYVIGHTGFVPGERLIVPTALAAPVDDSPQSIKEKGFPIFVTKEGLPKPPDGWKKWGTGETTYQVVTTPDGRVTELQAYGTGHVEDANWIIDLAVELVVAPVMLGLARPGARMGMSLIESQSARQAPKVKVLAGPTPELAKDATALAKAGVNKPVTKMAKVPGELSQNSQEITDVLTDVVLGVKKARDHSRLPGELGAHIGRLRQRGILTPDRTQAELALREARKILRKGEPSDTVQRKHLQDLVDRLHTELEGL